MVLSLLFEIGQTQNVRAVLFLTSLPLRKVKKRKEDFNEKVLGCQEKKRDLLQTLETLRDQLLLIQIQLKPEQREQVPDLPTLHKDELAKDGFEVSLFVVTSNLRRKHRLILTHFLGTRLTQPKLPRSSPISGRRRRVDTYSASSLVGPGEAQITRHWLAEMPPPSQPCPSSRVNLGVLGPGG